MPDENGYVDKTRDLVELWVYKEVYLNYVNSYQAY